MGEYAEMKMMGAKMTRSEFIRAHRRLQPIEELRRKAAKAKTRSNLHTAEELDLATAEAIESLVGLIVE